MSDITSRETLLTYNSYISNRLFWMVYGVWKMFYFKLQERDEIQFESYARIEHMLTGCWLHALKGMSMYAYLLEDQ